MVEFYHHGIDQGLDVLLVQIFSLLLQQLLYGVKSLIHN